MACKVALKSHMACASAEAKARRPRPGGPSCSCVRAGRARRQPASGQRADLVVALSRPPGQVRPFVRPARSASSLTWPRRRRQKRQRGPVGQTTRQSARKPKLCRPAGGGCNKAARAPSKGARVPVAGGQESLVFKSRLSSANRPQRPHSLQSASRPAAGNVRRQPSGQASAPDNLRRPPRHSRRPAGRESRNALGAHIPRFRQARAGTLSRQRLAWARIGESTGESIGEMIAPSRRTREDRQAVVSRAARSPSSSWRASRAAARTMLMSGARSAPALDAIGLPRARCRLHCVRCVRAACPLAPHRRPPT